MAVVEKDVVIRVEGSARLEDLLDGREIVDQLAVESEVFGGFVNFDVFPTGTFGFFFHRFVLLGDLKKEAGSDFLERNCARLLVFTIFHVPQFKRQKLVEKAVVPAESLRHPPGGFAEYFQRV